jgi:hypothetical protein
MADELLNHLLVKVRILPGRKSRSQSPQDRNLAHVHRRHIHLHRRHIHLRRRHIHLIAGIYTVKMIYEILK